MARFIRRDGTIIDMTPPPTPRLVRCTKCGTTAPYDEWPEGRDFFQNAYIAKCVNAECDNRQSPGDAAMRMFGGERPFEFVRPSEPTDDALTQALHRAHEAS